ncbi:MAG: O-antigen ligase family protein, partial [Candidatus Pacebacteria bacterium]|nr:O-antigen ligase family protein [Candidatus Paceibacterota bacterium]
MEGVLGIWYFIAFFLVIATTFERVEIEKILKTQVFIGLFHSFLALLAFLNIGGVMPYYASARLSGYTGNPSFFAVYLLFNAFLALYFYFDSLKSLQLERSNSKDNKIRASVLSAAENLFPYKNSVIWFLIFLTQSLLIFVTLTRGAMIGYLGGIILIALGIIFLSKDKNLLPFKKIAIVFLILIIGISVFTFAGKNTNFVKNNQILNRFASISLEDPTAKSRLFSIGTAWKSFLEKPLFGWGQENYEAAYIKNFNPEVLKYLPEDFYFDRAHNKPMEVLATNGIFGFLSYLSIFGVAVYLLNKLRGKQEWFLPSLALIGCLAGYFIQNIFIFDFHESYLMFFLVLAFIASLSEMTEERDSRFYGNDKKRNCHPERSEESLDLSRASYALKMARFLAIIAIICAVIFSTTQWVIKPYLVSKGIMNVGFLMKQGKGEEAYQELKRLINNPTFLKEDIIIGDTKIYNLYSSKIAEEDQRKIVEALALEAEKAAQKRPWQFGLIAAKGELETICSKWDKDWLVKMGETTKMMLDEFPYFPQAHLFAAKFYLLNGETEKGIEAAQKVIEIGPKIASTYYILGVGYVNLGDTDKANENLIKAAELGYPFQDKEQILYIVNLLIPKKDYLTIEKLYLRAIQIDPRDDSLYRSLAATYGRMRNKQKAIEYAKKAVEINPLVKQAAEEFIQLIENEQWEAIAD